MSVGLRPYLASDAKRCAAIFRAAISEIAIEDYSEEACEAWAARAEDLKAFADRLGAALTLIGFTVGEPAGFASLKDGSEIDMLYVDPEYSRQGVATTLIEALERIAFSRGAPKLTVDASDTSKPLFERAGFRAERRNVVRIGKAWCGNTSMNKALGAKTSEH